MLQPCVLTKSQDMLLMRSNTRFVIATQAGADHGPRNRPTWPPLQLPPTAVVAHPQLVLAHPAHTSVPATAAVVAYPLSCGSGCCRYAACLPLLSVTLRYSAPPSSSCCTRCTARELPGPSRWFWPPTWGGGGRRGAHLYLLVRGEVEAATQQGPGTSPSMRPAKHCRSRRSTARTAAGGTVQQQPAASGMTATCKTL